jgi:hypothetical protein
MDLLLPRLLAIFTASNRSIARPIPPQPANARMGYLGETQ